MQRRDPLRLLELVAVDRRRVDVDPADAEADPRRTQPVGQRQRPRLAVAGDHDPVHLGPLDVLLEDRLLRRRRRERLVQVRVDVVDRLDEEDPALAAGVGRLQHRREADLVGGAMALRQRAHRSEPRLRHARLGERAPHRDLVRHQVRGRRPDPRQPARLGDRGHDGHRAVGRHRQHAVERLALDGLEHRLDVREVDDEAAVGDLAARARRRCGRRRARAGPSSFARRIARRWWRPAPTKRTVFTASAMLLVSLVPRIGG